MVVVVRRFCRLRVLALTLVCGIDDLADFRWLLDYLQHREISGGDASLGEHAGAQPLQQAIPLAIAEEDHREVADRRGLDQRERLEALVERPVAARRDDKSAGVADEHHLAREEVAEAKPDVQIGVQRLLTRQFDVAADRQRSGIARAAVRRLHQPRTAPGDDRVAGVAQARADLTDQRVVGVLARRARRPKYRHGASHAGQRVKPTSELTGDVADALRVGASYPRRLVAEPQQQLLVKGRLLCGALSLVFHGPSVEFPQ